MKIIWPLSGFCVHGRHRKAQGWLATARILCVFVARLLWPDFQVNGSRFSSLIVPRPLVPNFGRGQNVQYNADASNGHRNLSEQRRVAGPCQYRVHAFAMWYTRAGNLFDCIFRSDCVLNTKLLGALLLRLAPIVAIKGPGDERSAAVNEVHGN